MNKYLIDLSCLSKTELVMNTYTLVVSHAQHVKKTFSLVASADLKKKNNIVIILVVQ